MALLDREDELHALRGAFAAARAGQGSLILVEGAAGSGKSALLSEGRRLAARADLRVLSAIGAELERRHPFGIIRQLYEGLLQDLPSEQQSRLLGGAAAPAGAALRLNEDNAGMHAAGFGVMDGVYWLTRNLSNQRPLALIVDDIHWGDRSSLRSLDYLARRIGGTRTCLITSLRSQEPGSPDDLLDQLRSAPQLIPLTLRPLSWEAVQALVRERHPQADERACLACHEMTSGNPLYLRELLRVLDERGPLVSAQDVREAAVPSLGELVVRRTARVAPGAPRLAKAMAVLGDGSGLGVAGALAEIPRDQTSEVAYRLRRIEILASEDPVVFVHPLVRRSIYDSLPAWERERLHQRAAELLKMGDARPEAVAAQFAALPPRQSARVAATLLEAGEDALQRAAPDEAVGFLERALLEEAPDPSPVLLRARLGLGRTLLRDPQAVVDLREAFRAAEQPALRIQVGILLAEVLSQAGHWSEAHEALVAIEDDVAAVGGTELEAAVAAVRGCLTLYDPAQIQDFDRRRDHYVRLSALDLWPGRALAVLLAMEASGRGRIEESRAFTRSALQDDRLLGERGAGAWAPPQLGGVLIQNEDFETAHAFLEQLDVAGRTAGSAMARLTAVAYTGWVQTRQGDLVAAEARMTRLLEIATEQGLLMGLATAAFLMIDLLVERTVPPEIARTIEATELSEDFGATMSGAMLLEARAALRQLSGERDLAVGDLRRAGEILVPLGFGPVYSTWRSSLALALAGSDENEALKLAREELELAGACGLARPRGVALRALGLLSGTAGLDLLRHSVEVLAQSPLRLEHARSLVELGAALRRANRRSEGREPLMEGLRLAETCGALRLRERARAELRAGGGRRARVISTGVEALTPTERRVAEMAARGLSNPQIAGDLYVSLKTVETHLSRAYAKLGLSGSGSRERLRELLGDEGTAEAPADLSAGAQ